MRKVKTLYVFLFFILISSHQLAQVSDGVSATYGLRKIIPTYSGNALQVRRTCDNGLKDIGFNSCGDLDTVALKTFVVAANPLSAMAIVSATAYSLRRLRCGYPGSAIRVRSSAAGNPTSDIGFTLNGDLDTAALKTFIGSNSGFVTIWYDQSGNARDASQATAASQPRIVNAGIVERQGGMPAVRFLGMGCTLSTAAFTTYNSAACFNGVVKVATDLTYNTFINKTTINFPAPLDLYNSQMVIGNGSSYTFFSYGQTLSASLPLSIWTYQAASGGSYNFYYNGSSTGSGSVNFYGDNGNPLVLGGRNDALTGLNGYISESLTFNSLPSTTERQFLEWSQSQYYSVSGPALTTLPVAPASGFVTTWYDQSGNNKQVTQSTTSNQPHIILAGSVHKQNTSVAIGFNGSTYLSASDAGLPTGNLAVTAIVKANAISSYGSFLHYGSNGAGNAVFGSYGTDGNYGTNAIGLSQFGNALGIPNSVGPTLIFTSGRSATNYSVYSNGGSASFKTMASNTTLYGANGLCIGAFNPGTSGGLLDGSITELSLFSSALSNTKRILLETNYSAFTGIAVSANKYTPPTTSSYQRFVNGVGRESSTDSVSGTRSTAGLGIIVGQTASDFLKDNGDYITYGINCPVSATISTSNLPGTIVQRWFNDWYLNKTDIGSNNGTLNLFFDFSDYGTSVLPGTVANYELLSRSTSSGAFSIVSGTTKSIVGDRVVFSVDASNIPTNFYYTIGTRNMAASPLPIDLLSFGAACSGAKVKISWSVASQKNNDHFSIDRSEDGINFETIGIVKGEGTSSVQKSYSYTDDRPIGGLSYYRLKQTDYDGSETTYKLSSVSCEASDQGIVVYPNPNSGAFTLEGAKLYSDVIIYDRFGRKVYEQKNILAKEEIHLNDLPEGVYVVMVVDSTGQTALKFILQH